MKEYTVKVDDNGNKYWYLNEVLHREDGPAIEDADGDKYWYLNGRLHREDGPAVEHANGLKFWILDDIEYSEEEYWNKVKTTYEL